MHSFTNLLVMALAVASTASAHMKISSPAPINAANINNFPLKDDGSDFPCKFGSNGYTYSSDSTENQYTIGTADNQLSFIGSAVHGGGSCQVSLTYDRPPTKDSVWKVITSIEGGCPARDTPGNFPLEDPNYIDPYTYNFTIPDGLEAGQYTLALTWFNKLGNREMYMNCAHVTLDGTGGDKSTYNSLPDMMVANINNGCSTINAKDVEFPDPGQYIQYFNGQTSAFEAPTGQCGAAAPTTVPAPTYADSVPAADSTETYGAPSDGPVTVPNSIPTGGVFMPISDSLVGPATTSFATRVSTTLNYNSPTPTPTSVSSSGEYEVGSHCDYSQEGVWNCIDENTFQRCASGEWSAVTHLSSGIICTPGTSSDFTYKAAGSRIKRALHIGAKMVRF
ncbi:hypothetical protein BROUX41_001676 [Berkeleyomyces rouxiae]